MNNIPAFPSTHHNGWGEPEKGMALRDYFATHAMQGAISGCASRGEVIMYADLAGLSYEVADAMMKEREA